MLAGEDQGHKGPCGGGRLWGQRWGEASAIASQHEDMREEDRKAALLKVAHTPPPGTSVKDEPSPLAQQVWGWAWEPALITPCHLMPWLLVLMNSRNRLQG